MNAVTLPAIALGYAGFTALCLAMERHGVQLQGRPVAAARRRQWRWLGWLLLSISLALCVHARGWGIGLVLWVGTLTASAAVLVLALLPYRQAVVVPLAWTAPVLAVAAWLALG